jgi:hypothetical protein
VKVSGKSQTLSDPTSARFGERIPFELPVRLGTDGRALGRGIVRNASLSGALIETALELPLHTNLVVRMTIPGKGTPAPRELAACVVRVDPSGIGIEWRDMASVDVTDLLERAADYGAVD